VTGFVHALLRNRLGRRRVAGLDGADMLLKAGDTCWRAERADRGALIIDMAEYFAAAKAAFLAARSTIHLLNWAFDPDTLFEPRASGSARPEDRIGPFLRKLACDRPELDVRILCWKSALPIAATQGFFPHRAKKCFDGTPVKFLLDASVPLGACHHQKMIIVDDAVAFCGGGDIAPDRWDTAAHLDHDPRRRKSRRSTKDFASRHELMSVVEGPAAAALGALFRDRWRRATGETPPSAARRGEGLWPERIAPDFRGIAAGISRTIPRWSGALAVRENEALHLAAIKAARRCIYLENQYVTSPLIAEALAERLAEADGPEVVLVSTAHSPSWFDQATMDRARSRFLRAVAAADRHGRFRAYLPVTKDGEFIIVHAKLAVIDDRLLRIGSANLVNRSMGFDTECDLSFEARSADRPARATIAALRTRLIAHWLGCGRPEVELAIAEAGGVGAGIERLRAAGFTRLHPLTPSPLGPLAAVVASWHLGDPVGVTDSWRPWKRGAALQLRREIAAAALDVGGACAEVVKPTAA